MKERRGISALNDHAVAVTGASVTDRAVNVESFPPAIQQGTSDGDRKSLDKICAGFSLVECLVFIEMSAGHCARDQQARTGAISEQITGTERIVSGLIEHIPPATRGRSEQCETH